MADDNIKVASLCAGYGGLEIALDLCGIDHDVSWYAEIDEDAATVMQTHHPESLNRGDLCEITECEPVDIVTAGFPCQPVSAAGQREGIEDSRWIIEDVCRVAALANAKYLILENVPGILSGGTDVQTHRCVCGWPDRRGGLATSPSRTGPLHPTGHSNQHDQSGPTAVTANASGVRGIAEEEQRSDRPVGGNALVESQRSDGGRIPGENAPVLGDQTASGSVDHQVLGDQEPPEVIAGKQTSCLDRTGEIRSGTAAVGDDGVQQDWPEDRPFAGLVCPKCGRDLGDASSVDVRSTWMGAVQRAMAGHGFSRWQWCTLRASDVGAPHQRKRWFCVASHSDVGSFGLQPFSFGRGSNPVELGQIRQAAENADIESRFQRREPTPGQTQRRWSRADTGRRGGAPATEPDDQRCESIRRGIALRDRGQERGRDPDGCDRERFGGYAEAVRRWETVTGRTAPDPTRDSRLNPVFVEWMMGLPEGHVTDVGLKRADQLRILGNGVVPQQAAKAIQSLGALLC